MPDFAPTDEQAAALAAFRSGDNLVLEAGAGAGKTSTLKLLAKSAPLSRGVYFAFNRSTATDARRSFPDTVLCSTLHGLAYRAVAAGWVSERLNSPRQSAKEQCVILGVAPSQRFALAPAVFLTGIQVVRIAARTVTAFCQSQDPTISARHLPHLPGLEDHRTPLGYVVLPIAQRMWADITSPDGKLRFTHDYYLKMWALTHPSLGADYVFLDEAQDSNGLTVGIVKDQAAAGAQIVTVGDANQAIYGFRGASDAMGEFGGQRLSLTQSFRFGPAIANEANKWLTALRSSLRIKGTPTLLSTLDDLDGPTPEGERAPDAILTRTNAGAVSALMRLLDAKVPAGIVGGADQIRSLAEAAISLRDTQWTSHPELVAFSTWKQVQDYAEEEVDGSDLAVAVRLIDEHTPETILKYLSDMPQENRSTVLISTAHKAKGREWEKVRIHDDFREPKRDEDGQRVLRRDEAMLAYVAVTRAKKVLDVGSLDWINRYLAEDAKRVAA